MKIAIILNGNYYNFKPYINKDYFIIAADGGANHCYKCKIKPHLILGDLDSIAGKTKKYFHGVPQVKIPDQKTTDLEKVLNYLKKNIKNIKGVDIFCATSLNRVDHFLANIFSICNSSLRPIRIIDQHFIIRFIDRNTELIGLKNKTVSLFPMEHCAGLKLSGFQWPLNHKKYSISNVITKNPAHVKIAKGKIILIINN